MKLVNLQKETRKLKKILIFLCCLCCVAIESVGKHIPMAFVERVKEDFHGYQCTPNSMNKEFGYFWLSTIKFRSKPGEERPGGSCSWILVTLNAEKVVNHNSFLFFWVCCNNQDVAALRFVRKAHNLFDDTLHNWNHSSTNSHIKKQMMEWRTDETERIHMRLMNFVMLQELMKQLTNFKSSEAMWRSSVKLGGAEVQSLKTRNGITTSVWCEKLDDRGGKTSCCGDASRSVVRH
ncbi:hypothetical protein HID58_091563 [Brassica napus]|uniref:Uncharacterized protein n=1 Tax=Brassica napus TaxID=3708 RepID=A0ABQ7WZI8_BRANA|nr:hypothetical protein HID58_091563 [Brassica napus]